MLPPAPRRRRRPTRQTTYELSATAAAILVPIVLTIVGVAVAGRLG